MNDLVLGIDGGGSKTLAALADRSGDIVARLEVAGLDPTAGDGWEGRLAEVASALPGADHAWLGLPFHDEIPAMSERQDRLALELFGPRARVVNDVAVAFEGALGGDDGVLILSGTGSMAWARGPAGTHRVGGWGGAFGDEGSAFWIGREALARVARHLDGRGIDPSFADALLASLEVAPDDLIDWTYARDNPRTALASVARHVSRLGALENQTATSLLRDAARELTRHGETATRLCGLRPPPRWSYAGGAFADRILREATTAGMGVAPATPLLPPVGGAIVAAARAAAWPVDAEFLHRLATSLAE